VSSRWCPCNLVLCLEGQTIFVSYNFVMGGTFCYNNFSFHKLYAYVLGHGIASSLKYKYLVLRRDKSASPKTFSETDTQWLSFWLTTYLLCLMRVCFNRQSAFIWYLTVLPFSATFLLRGRLHWLHLSHWAWNKGYHRYSYACFIPWPTKLTMNAGYELLFMTKKWFQVFHCELSNYMQQHSNIICIWSI